MKKTIHYCWFGRGEHPKLMDKCIASWKKYFPDYEIIEWNEDNFDLDEFPYTRYCYDNKKFAFLSDFVRLKVVYDNGGVYFDTDVEVIKSFDDILADGPFYGFETPEYVNTGLGFADEAGSPILKAMLDDYLALTPDENGVYPLFGCPRINTKSLIGLGLIADGTTQKVCGKTILPLDYLNPYDDLTGKLDKTENTHSIHWYSKSWMSPLTILKSKLTQPLHRIFGINFLRR